MSDTQKTRPTTKFSTKEILKLRGLLDTLTKPADSGNCSLALACNILYSYTLNALNSSKEVVWAVDSGVIDHMTQLSSRFIPYRPCSI